jgi:hypothetical protein
LPLLILALAIKKVVIQRVATSFYYYNFQFDFVVNIALFCFRNFHEIYINEKSIFKIKLSARVLGWNYICFNAILKSFF